MDSDGRYACDLLERSGLVELEFLHGVKIEVDNVFLPANDFPPKTNRTCGII